MSNQNRNFQQSRNSFSHQRATVDSRKDNWSSDFKPEWITQGIERETVSFAEKLGKVLADRNNGITTSQIRNVYGEMKRIQMSGFEKERTAFLLLLPKLSYAQVRNNKPGIKTFKSVFDKMHSLVEKTEHYDNLMKIMEAILAYHRAFGGKE